ncbi:hypothetical protein CGRA01v4_10853 [Colletotrichum graminicola]|nr:hypothetical protein CGRA01v4_10853 [Colletotrichum graminicola]
MTSTFVTTIDRHHTYHYVSSTDTRFPSAQRPSFNIRICHMSQCQESPVAASSSHLPGCSSLTGLLQIHPISRASESSIAFFHDFHTVYLEPKHGSSCTTNHLTMHVSSQLQNRCHCPRPDGPHLRL